MLDSIRVNQMKVATIPIQTMNFSRRTVLQIVVSPSKKSKDLVVENNSAYYVFYVNGPTAAAYRFFADGARVMDGDIVRTQPEFVVQLPEREEGWEGARSAEVFVDGMPLHREASAAHEGAEVLADLNEVRFTPRLARGTHEVRVRTIDRLSRGDLDTLEQSVLVEVNPSLGVRDVFNYPNPFAGDTYFTFTLTGDQVPDQVNIRIFTVAGRKVKEIMVPGTTMRIGNNRVYWDGRDADGDELANGYYFYQVSVHGEGKTESAIQKLVKLR
jgi:hypothetical protein